jgi:hypothetical protein
MSSISGINGSNSLYLLSQLLTNQSSTTTSEVDGESSIFSTDNTTEKSTNSIIFSPEGQIYNRLQQLQKSDPDKFKEVCAEIAAQLTEAAKKNGGTGAAELAAKFTGAAESGDMVDLTTSTTTATAASTATDRVMKARNTLNQYYQQYSTNQATGSSDISSILQNILGSLNTNI